MTVNDSDTFLINFVFIYGGSCNCMMFLVAHEDVAEEGAVGGEETGGDLETFRMP